VKFLIRNKKQCVLAKPFKSNNRGELFRISPNDYEVIPLATITDSWVQEVEEEFNLIIVVGEQEFQDLYVVDSFSSREEVERNNRLII
jgi:hypothetical protein